MNLLTLLLIVFVLLLLFGNPHLGSRVYQGYDFGYWPSGVGLVLVIVLLILLLR